MLPVERMLHVLVVEDNPGDIPLINEAVRLFATDAEVLVAYDGEEALRYIEELAFKPNIVFLDLNVPKVDGLEILQRQGSEAGPPIIVLTSSSNPEDRRRALKLGAI